MSERDDMNLMLYFDGELSPEEEARVRAELAADDEAAAVVTALDQISEVARTHLELAGDDAEPRLDRLWGRIERVIGANGAADEPAPAAAAARPAPSDAGLIAAVRRWFAEHRGHLATSAVTAGAVAALILVVFRSEPRVIERPGPERIVQVPVESSMPVVPVVSQPAAVEELSVNEGTGYILTIPGDDEGDNDTTVIWIEPDESEVEGPI